MKTLLYSTLCVAIGAMTAGGKDRTVTCRLMSVVQGESAPAEIFLDPGDGKRPIPLQPMASIDAQPVEIPVSGEGKLRFTDGKGADAAVIGEASVPEGAESLVVFVMPDSNPDDELSYHVAALDAQPEALKDGGLVFYNGGSSEAKVTVGDESKDAAPAESGVFGSPGPKDDFNMVPVMVEVKDGERWRKVKDSASQFVGQIVYWVVLFEDPKVKRPQLRIYKAR